MVKIDPNLLIEGTPLSPAAIRDLPGHVIFLLEASLKTQMLLGKVMMLDDLIIFPT